VAFLHKQNRFRHFEGSDAKGHSFSGRKFPIKTAFSAHRFDIAFQRGDLNLLSALLNLSYGKLTHTLMASASVFCDN